MLPLAVVPVSTKIEIRKSVFVQVDATKNAVETQCNVCGAASPSDVGFCGEFSACEVVEGVAKEQMCRASVALGVSEKPFPIRKSA